MSTDMPVNPGTENPGARNPDAANPDAEDVEAETEFIDDGVLYDDEVTPEYGILGFTLRELLIVGVWAVSFVLSFFPVVGDASLWEIGIQWVLPIALPTVAVFLIVLRRFSPDGIRRVGSLGIDQFASVAFSVSATIWAGSFWLAVGGLIENGFWGLPWNGVLLLVASLALVALTVFAPIIPGLKEDFHGRLVTLAHRNANPVRPVIPRPRPEPASDGAGAHAPQAPAPGLDVELTGDQTTDEIARPEVADHVPLAAHASGGGTGTAETTADQSYTPGYARKSRAEERAEEIVSDTDSIVALVTPDDETSELPAVDDQAAEAAGAPASDDADLDATNPRSTTPDPRSTTPDPQPFWILAPTEREIHDERGQTIFTIGPTAWALVIEDRGGAYVVRHDDGRIGYLHDISGITKG